MTVQRTWDFTNGGFTTRTVERPAATSSAISSPSAARGGVEQRQPDADLAGRARTCRWSPRRPASPSPQHGHVGARDAPVEGLDAPQQRGAGRRPSRRAARRGPRTASFPQPTAQPEPGLDRGDLAATGPGRAAGTPSRCAACRGRPARRRPPSGAPAASSASHSAAASSDRDDQLVPVLAGVAGPADDDVAPSNAARRSSCTRGRSAGRAPSSSSRRAGALHGQDGEDHVLVDHLTPSGAAATSRRTTSAVLAALGMRNTSLVAEPVGDEVVHHAAVVVAAQRVLRLAGRDPVQVVAEAAVDEVGRARPAHPWPCPGATRRTRRRPRGPRCAP